MGDGNKLSAQSLWEMEFKAKKTDQSGRIEVLVVNDRDKFKRHKGIYLMFPIWRVLGSRECWKGERSRWSGQKVFRGSCMTLADRYQDWQNKDLIPTGQALFGDGCLEIYSVCEWELSFDCSQLRPTSS